MSDVLPQPPVPKKNISVRSHRQKDRAPLSLQPAMRDRYNNFPAQPTPLIDRQHELSTVRRLLLQDDVRLLTLTGAPGVGKTRLAIEIAAGMLDEFECGACFVDLTQVSDSALVVSAIAHAIQVREVPGQPLFEGIKHALGQQHLLLVLDNFEQVMAATPVLSDLLAACSELRILVTSREALHLRWEHIFPVPSLGLPDLGHLPTPEALSDYPALTLFVERARAMRPDFRLDALNTQAVAEICVQLDGLPLAIELAAARVNVFPPAAIQTRLHRRLDLLTRGAQDFPVRHQTLRGAIDWSHDLLTPMEKSVFRRLGVFVGGCTLEAAEAVCAEQGQEAACTLEALTSLVEKSLLRAEEQQDGQPRFRLLETMREYALEQLEAAGKDEVQAIRRRHAEFFLALAERAEPRLFGREQTVWLARLDGELDNFRAAMAWSLSDNGDPEIGLGVGGVLWHYWDLRSLLSEGRRWLSALLSATPARTAARVKALNMLSYLAFMQGDLASNGPPLEEALAVAQEIGDTFGLALTLCELGGSAHLAGDNDRAVPLLERSCELSRSLNRGLPLYIPLAWMARVTWSRGEHERALALMEECLAAARECGDDWASGHLLFFLGNWAYQRSDHERAIPLLRESLALHHKLDDRMGVALCMDELACVSVGQADWERAARLSGAAEALRGSIGAGVLANWQSDLGKVIASVRAGLGEEQFQAAQTEGRSMLLAEAISYALSSPDHVPSVAGHQTPISRQAFPLTVRERHVAILIARGLSNQQIASELVISKRTADGHVGNILWKLGFSSRAQIAAWAVEQGLLRSAPLP